MEQNTYEFIPKIPDIFCCKACDYITSIKKDYNKHLLTLKHARLTSVSENTYQKFPPISCICGSRKEESEKNYEKIIKNIAKEVVIDKQAYK